ncbi:hypothetical protein R1sor_012613 [Riccia sorocarpa]|uniref:Uncharacterized protein n=1 Tax=Riccia sorocarpa TaxID=122646 RepID=A0ABD3I498_9MARC
MSPPRVLFSQLPSLASIGNAEIEEHEKNAQDENEDDGPFASEAPSDSEEDKDPEQVLVSLQPADGKYHLPNNFTKKEVYDH